MSKDDKVLKPTDPKDDPKRRDAVTKQEQLANEPDEIRKNRPTDDKYDPTLSSTQRVKGAPLDAKAQEKHAKDSLAKVVRAYHDLKSIESDHRVQAVAHIEPGAAPEEFTRRANSKSIVESTHLRLALESLGFLVKEFGGSPTELQKPMDQRTTREDEAETPAQLLGESPNQGDRTFYADDDGRHAVRPTPEELKDEKRATHPPADPKEKSGSQHVGQRTTKD